MRDAQQQAADFAREHGLSLSAQGRFIDLVSEIGELGKEILKQPAMRRSHLPTIRRLRRRWATACFLSCVCAAAWGWMHRMRWNWRCKNMRSGL